VILSADRIPLRLHAKSRKNTTGSGVFMHNKELILEALQQIEDAAGKAISRFGSIQNVSDFTDSQPGWQKGT